MEGKENIRVEVRDRGARQEEEKAAFVTKIKTEHVNLYYGERQVLKDITFDMGENKVTAFIGPSGCGKSSYLRCLNRMNDFISSARVEGTINIDGENILAPSTDVIGLRRKVGMVFQKPNPFPMYEPTSALDPMSTLRIEELVNELKKDYTVVIVTHNMQQAARISDYTAFFLLGDLIEYDVTAKMFTSPHDKRTEDYISGRFG